MCDTIQSARAAADQIHEALTFANEHLGRVSARLEKEYARRHARSPSHTSPYNVLSRIRTLQNELPQLKQDLLQCHNEKRDIVNTIHAQLQTSHQFCEQMRPLISSATQSSQSDALTGRLSQLRDQLHLVAQVIPPAITNGHKNPASAILSKTSSDEPNECQMPASVPASSAVGEGIAQKAANSCSSATVTPKSGDAKGTFKTHDKVNETNFQPIGKATFNRLPRNLKIRAGKLTDINQFYESVYRILSNCANGCLSDAKLMDATGEKNLERFQVLRGLAVLRNGKEGWSLAASK